MPLPVYKLLKKFLSVLALLFVSIGLASAQLAAPQPPPYQWPRSHDYDVEHYRIAVSFDIVGKSLTGETTITLHPYKDNFKEVELDAGKMKIESVKLAAGSDLKYRYEKEEKLYVELGRPYKAGEDISIVVKYSANPKQGVAYIVPTESDPSRPYQIWTQGQPDTNHYWFPCYDYPNDRATSETIVTVDEKYQVISNGDLISVKPAANKKKTWHWKMDRAYASYLVSVVVGEFDEVKDSYKGKPVISYVPKGQTENGKLSFSSLPKMVEFFSEKFGYDYPFSKYVQTMVRDFPGAMENITATTMGDVQVRDKRALIDSSSDEIVAHELIHQWFGDLVTCRDWGEIWLNESFATYFANVWDEQKDGKDEYLHGIYQNQEAYFAVWNQGQRRPIRVRRYRGPNAVFDTYSYPRGSAVIHMLRSVLGEELFWKSIRYYLKKHQYQSVGTDDFVVAIEEATGQNLEWFFDQWIYNMGHPEFEVSSSYDENSKKLILRVKQTQKADSQRTWYNSPEFFIVPMDIGITTASGEKIERIIIDAVEKEFTFDLDSKPLIVNFDRGNAVIKQVKFDRSEEELIYQLLHDNDTMGRFRACLELRSKKNDTVAKALAEAARQDKFWGVRTRATDYLAEYRNDFSKAKLLELAKDGDSRVRRSAVRALAFAEDPNLADLFKELVKNEQSYNVLEEAARGLGATKSADAYDALAELLGQDSWQDAIRGAALLGFSQLKDPRSVDLMLKYAKPGNRVSMRSSAIFALAQLAKSDDRLYEVLTLAVRDESLQILFAAVQSLLSIGDTKAVSLLEEAAARKDLPAGAIDFLNNNIKRLKEVNSKKEQEDKKNEGVQ